MRASGPTALVAAVVLAAGGFALASCGSTEEPAGTTTYDYDSPTATPTPTETEPTPSANEPTVIRVVVANGSPEGGIVRETVAKGERVVLVVRSDVADQVHLHGYDLMRNVAAGGTARIRFQATVPGRFEVELEDRGAQIAELTVRP